MELIQLTILQLLILLLAAVAIGAVLYFIISGRMQKKIINKKLDTEKKRVEEWKRRYRNDMDLRDKEIGDLKKDQSNNTGNNEALNNLLQENKNLKEEINILQELLDENQTPEQEQEEEPVYQEATPVTLPPVAVPETHNYLSQLQAAQTGLTEQNNRIASLLENIETIKQQETQQQQILKEKENLTHRVDDLQTLLSHKQKELDNMQQQEVITKELTLLLDNAHKEFTQLQEKIGKLESQAGAALLLKVEHEDLKEANYKLQKDIAVQLQMVQQKDAEYRNLMHELAATEHKLSEANFERQQMQKKIAYLEELNSDIQLIGQDNEKLMEQIKRIGQLESMLQVVSQERDVLLGNE
jgi:DNA repair exonuclease SbcCD ATPase subunit